MCVAQAASGVAGLVRRSRASGSSAAADRPTVAPCGTHQESTMNSPPIPDPAEVVCSVVPRRRYHCPNLVMLDHHIKVLRRQIGPDSNCMPEWKQYMRQDIDRLLDRRLYLTLVSGRRRDEPAAPEVSRGPAGRRLR